MHRLARAAAAGTLLTAVVATLSPVVAADRTVTMRDNRYSPGTVTIGVGDTVTWTNDGALPHDASGNGWATSLLDAGQSDAVRFTRAGTYAYGCTIHADMRGRVVVRAAGAPIPPTDTDPGAFAPAEPSSPWLLVIVGGLVVATLTLRRLPPTG